MSVSIDCEEAATMKVTLRLTGDELIMVNNALAWLIQDKGAMDYAFCDDCKVKVPRLLDRARKLLDDLDIDQEED